MKKVTLNLTDIVEGKDRREHEAPQAYKKMMGYLMPAFLKELLRYTKGNKSHAARVSGLHRETLNRHLKEHDPECDQTQHGRGNVSAACKSIIYQGGE